MKKEDLVPIDASTFYEGMYIEGEIYFKFEKSYVLLCRAVILSAFLIEKIQQTEWSNRQLYVDRRNVDQIMELSDQFRQLQVEKQDGGASEGATEQLTAEEAERRTAMTAKLNMHKEYQDLRERLSDVMDVVTQENRIPKDLSDALVEDINTKISLTDTSLLIQCINNLRPPDDYLNAHAANVGMLNGMIGHWLKLPAEDIDALIQTGLLHDIGKLRLPVELLNKPGALTAEEFEVVKKHPIYSFELLKLSGETDIRILEGALCHHERVNGTGYPNKLPLEKIPLFSRITAVSDVYDAMVAKRPYKDRHSPFLILSDFAFNKFSNLDISIVNVFLDRMPMALLGKRVILSDGRTGEVAYVNPLNFEFPIVEINGQLVSTDMELKCVAMEDFLALAE